jgi:hypothetical protein
MKDIPYVPHITTDASSDAMFPDRVQPDPYDFGAIDDQEWFVDEIISHHWKNPRKLEFQV